MAGCIDNTETVGLDITDSRVLTGHVILDPDPTNLLSITPDGLLATPPAGATVPTGLVLYYAGVAAPAGYLLCDGSAISRATYASLFTVIGVRYGPGDNATTFNLPSETVDDLLDSAQGGSATVSGTDPGSAGGLLTGNSVYYLGTPVLVEASWGRMDDSNINIDHVTGFVARDGTPVAYFVIWKTGLGKGAGGGGGFSNDDGGSVCIQDTPPAGAHTYSLKAYKSNNGGFDSHVGGPVTLAVRGADLIPIIKT